MKDEAHPAVTTGAREHRLAAHAEMDWGGAMSLDAYFKRIGYAGPREASLDVLRELHIRHTQAIAFENLSPYLRLDMALDPASLYDKLVHGQRGGYCYEQNGLFKHVLDTLGFETHGLAGRVLWNMPADRRSPRTHMLLLVEAASERYIADVGFGGMTLTAPIRLVTEAAQETPHGPYRLTESGGEYVLNAQLDDEWKPLYAFNLEEHTPPDYELMNWYTSTHPRSLFVTDLIAARAMREGRHTLRNNRYGFRGLSGVKGEQRIRTVAELKALLSSVFGIEVPNVPHADERFARALEAD